MIEKMGLTFGDNPEHLWAQLRRFGGLLKYMSPAARMDFLEDLVGIEIELQLSTPEGKNRPNYTRSVKN
jgi:hypothetical protein